MQAFIAQFKDLCTVVVKLIKNGLPSHWGFSEKVICWPLTFTVPRLPLLKVCKQKAQTPSPPLFFCLLCMCVWERNVCMYNYMYMYVCVCLCIWLYVYFHVSTTTCLWRLEDSLPSQFSPMMWVWGNELRSSGLAERSFSCWATWPLCSFLLLLPVVC